MICIPVIRPLVSLACLLCGPAVSEQISIPVEIRQGGTVLVGTESAGAPLPETAEMKLADGEEGKITISFSDEGSYTYSLYQKEQNNPYIKTDSTVYILDVHTGDSGILESAVLYKSGTSEKSPSAYWQNTVLKPSVNTADSGIAKGYAAVSLVSLFIAAILFRIGGGTDEKSE